MLKHSTQWRPPLSLLISLLALFIALSGTTYAGTARSLLLGVKNHAKAQTSLSASIPRSAFQVTNTSKRAGAGAIGLKVAPGHSPLVVSRGAGKAINLNADSLDGKNSTAFLSATGKAADADKLDGKDSTAFYAAGSKVADSNLLDGKNSTAFLSTTGKAANADKLDGLDSTDFLRNLVPLALTGSTSSDGVISGTNTGNANGVQGITDSSVASGVYGQNNGGGIGVAGRSNGTNGVGVYAEALGGGVGVAIHTAGAPPLSVDSSARVDNLNADKVDGASIVSNRIVSTTANDHIIQLPGFGDFNVVSCDHANAVFQWSSGGPAAFVFWWDVLNTGDSFEGVANIVTSNARPHHFATVQLARDVGGNTSIATVTVTTHATDCVFAAQAVVQPG